MAENSAYELFDELGHGEHTVVYRGYDLDLGRDVAVKELNEKSRRDPRRASQFLKEASFLAQFEHEHILRIYSVDKDRGWIVMELMKGTLASQIADAPMAADTVRSVLRQILGALDFLHQKHKVHGAVRPSNILINEHGTAKLSDFEATDSDGELRAPTGSKKHLAPELIRPEFGEFGPTVDLYCLGFTALELLTGPKFESLFPGTGAGAIDADVAWLRWHSSDEALQSVKKLCPHVPDDLANVIDRLLSKNVEDRPQTAADVLSMLSEQAFVPVVVKEEVGATASVASAATAKSAPPKPTKTTQAGPPPKKSKAKKAAAAANKTTKDKINDFLGKPYILWPLCAAMLIGAVMIGLQLQDKGDATGDPEARLAQVQFSILPDGEGAKLFLNGEERTLRDDTPVELAAGQYEVKITKDGYEDHAQTLAVTTEDKQVDVLLKELAPPEEVLASLFLQINPDPSGARVSIDGAPKNVDVVGSYVMNPGTYVLQVEKSGFEPHTETISLPAGDTNMSISLQPLPPKPVFANVLLNITPESDGARVTFNGESAKPKQDGRVALEAGTYQLNVEKDGFEVHRQTVTLDPGDVELDVVLRSLPTENVSQLVKVRVSMPADARFQAGEDVVEFPNAKTQRVNFELEHSKDEPFAYSAKADGFEPTTRSITWEKLVAAKFKIDVALEPIEERNAGGGKKPEIVDPFGTMLVNAGDTERQRKEKTAALAKQFTGEAELVIDCGGFLGEISDVTFSPDGKLVAAAGGKIVRIWNVLTGDLVATLRGDRSRTSYGNVYTAKFSPDGKTLLVGINDYKKHGSIREYSTDDFSEIKRLIPGHTAPCRKIAFSGSGKRRMSVDADGNVLIADAATDKVLTTIRAEDPSKPIFDVATFPDANEDLVLAVDFGGPLVYSPAGKMLGPQDPMPDRIKTWFTDIFSQKVKYPFGATKDPRVLGFAMEKGEWAAAGVTNVDGRNRFWAAVYPARGSKESGGDSNPKQIYSGHRWSITCLELGPGALAVSGDKFGEVHVWNRKTGKLLRKFKGQGKSIYEVAFDQNSNRIAFGTRPFKPDVWNRNNYGTATRVLDLRQRAILPRSASGNLSLSNEQPKRGTLEVGVSRGKSEGGFSVNLKQGGNVLSKYRMASARNPTIFSLIDQPKLGVQHPVVFGDNEGLLALWDTSGDELRRAFIGHGSLVSGVSFAANGKLMVSASTDRTIRIWSLENHRPTGTFDFKYENTSVIKLAPGSSSAKAGVQVGDEIVSMDGLSVTDMYNLMLQKKFKYRPGQVVPVKMKRDGREYTYNMTMADGYDFEEPTLSFYVGDDDQWIMWSPAGYYDASPGADRLIGWHVNRGPAKSAKYYEVQQFRGQLYRPDVIDQILEGHPVEKAVKIANEARQSGDDGRDFRSPAEIAEFHPPEVKIVRPTRDAETTSTTFSFEAQVSSPNGLPIKEVTLLHNGDRVKVFRPTGLSDEIVSIKHDVELTTGRNRLEVIASNSRASSEVVGANVLLKAKTPSTAGDVHVLAIGVSKHESPTGDLQDLKFASKDAQTFAKAIQAHKNGKLYRNVNVRMLTDQQATRTNVLDGFQWLVDSVKPKDSVVVFFSGHGFVDTSDNFYLATHDADVERPRATTVSWRQFTDMLHEDLPECKRLVFLDARPTRGGLKPGMRNPLLDLAAPELGTTFFASNTLQQSASDTANTTNGAFVQAIVDTLRDKASDQMPADQLFNPVELAQSIKTRVQKASAGRQLPTAFAQASQKRRNLLQLFTSGIRN